MLAFNRKCGVDVQEISPNEVKRLFPLCKTDDILAGFYVPDDGRVNPVDASMALAKGARMKGARIVEGVRVSGIHIFIYLVMMIICDYIVKCR